MKKRVISFLTAVILLVSLMPMPTMALNQSEESEIKGVVTEVIQNFAKQVYRENADDDAFNVFFKHGFFGNGVDMILDDNSSMVSSMFNSCLLQEALIVSLSSGICMMNEMQFDTMYFRGNTAWHNYYKSYGFEVFDAGERDFSRYFGTLIHTSRIYGNKHYQGPLNENDSVMELLAGMMDVSYAIRRVSVDESTVRYKVDLVIHDDFDFNGGYGEIANKGYNTSKDDALKDIGLLLTIIGLDDFYWKYETVLEIETTNYCDHETQNHHWAFDRNTLTFTSEHGNGFTKNQAVHREYEAKLSTGETKIRNYYELDDPVVLRHDSPWIIEYDQVVMRTLHFGSLDTVSNILPSLYSYGSNNVWLYYIERTPLPQSYWENREYYTSKTCYLGVEIKDQFDYNRNHKYTNILENVITDDGKNMIYLTIYDNDLGETVFGPEPMDDYWTMDDVTEERVLESTSSDKIVGRDIIINYLGSINSNIGLPETYLDMRVWPHGKNGFTDPTDYQAPTCTEQGGTVHTCRDCGYSYITEPVPALGHSYGEYVFDNNASCTADGTQTRKCTVCGEKDTVTAPETATGHSYESIVTEPTYIEQGYTTYTCTVCGDSYKDNFVDVKKHSYVGVVTEPTCTAQGFTTYTCSECGDSYVDDYTDLAEHTPVIDPAVKPTCSEKGKTEGSHCGVCGYVIKKQALISTNDNHTMEESIVKMPTYDEPGLLAYICTGCGKTDYMEIPPLNKPLVNPFTDVTESDWFYEPVLWAVENKVTGGKTETTFAPNEGCTRAQVVTFLWAANGKPEPTTENPFTDVSNDAWYLKPVLWAVEQGITTGVTATEFGPEQTCTRAQIATFLWAANGKPAVSASSEFVDVGDTDWYSTPIIWAKENDVTGGIGDGKFGPNDTCTRAQVVTFLKKVYANK